MSMPEVSVILSDLRKMSQVEAARQYGVTPSAICVKLRRAGFPRGESIQKKPSRKPPAVMVARAEARPDTVTRVTSGGATVTMPRVKFIDGWA